VSVVNQARSARGFLWLAASLLSIHGGLLAYAATCHSPTALEPALLASGISHWRFGRFELYRVNPPLVRAVASLPVLAVGCEIDWERFLEAPGARPEQELGDAFVSANSERILWLLTIARWACIPFSVLGGLFCFLWARNLYGGVGAGTLALVLWCFDPSVLGHGELITNDVAAASLGLGAGYFFWRWLQSLTWTLASLAGVLLGLAIIAKMTWLILLVLWPMVAVAWFMARQRSAERERLRGRVFFGQLALALVTGIYLINLGYLFDGSFTRCSSFQFVSKAFRGNQSACVGNRWKDSYVGFLPLPLPEQFVLGLDTQIEDLEHSGRVSYLAGEWRDCGWWYYYLYGLLVKAPHGAQVLFLLVLAARFRRPLTGITWDELVLLTPAIAVFVVVSVNTAFNHHFRYVLPCFGFGFVFLGQAVSVVGHYGTTRRAIACVLVTYSVLSTLWTYPHLIAYFNEAAGGPRNGHTHMLHSSLDWGQDLLYLKSWLDEHPDVRPLELAYSGGFDPSAVGMGHTHPPVDRRSQANGSGNQREVGLLPGWYALSVNHVWAWPGDYQYQYFQRFHPIASAGYSIYIYHITLDEANRVRRELGLPELTVKDEGRERRGEESATSRWNGCVEERL
jgi:hypothetical protein